MGLLFVLSMYHNFLKTSAQSRTKPVPRAVSLLCLFLESVPYDRRVHISNFHIKFTHKNIKLKKVFKLYVKVELFV